MFLFWLQLSVFNVVVGASVGGLFGGCGGCEGIPDREVEFGIFFIGFGKVVVVGRQQLEEVGVFGGCCKSSDLGVGNG